MRAIGSIAVSTILMVAMVAHALGVMLLVFVRAFLNFHRFSLESLKSIGTFLLVFWGLGLVMPSGRTWDVIYVFTHCTVLVLNLLMHAFHQLFRRVVERKVRRLIFVLYYSWLRLQRLILTVKITIKALRSEGGRIRVLALRMLGTGRGGDDLVVLHEHNWRPYKFMSS